jgi:hypothetical protein
MRNHVVELLFTDVTLRAEVDGATARVHRGVLAAYSPVLREAVVGTTCEVVPLPGKSKAELDLLVAWMYRRYKNKLTKVRCLARSSHGRFVAW